LVAPQPLQFGIPDLFSGLGRRNRGSNVRKIEKIASSQKQRLIQQIRTCFRLLIRLSSKGSMMNHSQNPLGRGQGYFGRSNRGVCLHPGVIESDFTSFETEFPDDPK